MAGDERKKMLLNLVVEVKARLDGKVDSLSFPIPQFIVIGKQSVGKSRLIEALAGEPFNFVSGTLGSRRPTVLEFRNVPGLTPSRWSIFDDKTGQWIAYPITDVMHIIGQAHESLGQNVSEKSVRVKVEGADCTDLGIVDLPGFRAYAKDEAMQALSNKIIKLAEKFMADENNVMICVEEAGDAAGFATLSKCRKIDPGYRRTILVRNKLDKYYRDLTSENVNKWLQGYGDLPANLARFALSLPHWTGPMPKPFSAMRQECSDMDVKMLVDIGCSAKYTSTLGFQNFRTFMEVKIQQLFADALAPLLSRLNYLKDETESRLAVIKQESETINEDNILHATRSAGITFAQSFNFLMEGALSSEENRCTMEEELRAFGAYCDKTGYLKPSERCPALFGNLDAYIQYLGDTVKVPGMNVQLNGGAQFRRLMYEVEVYTRFAALGHKFTPTDVIQVRGAGLHDITWQEIITSLMMQSAPTQMQEKTKYVGERIKWFFGQQKEATIRFMLGIKGSPEEHMFSRLIYKQAQVIQRNDTMKACIYKTFDDTCAKHQEKFTMMWNDFMQSMFQSPLILLKSCSMPKIGGFYEGEMAPTFESTKERIAMERQNRGMLQTVLQEKIKQIPLDDSKAKQAVQLVQEIIEQTFSVIRCITSDQMQLYSESFFLLPMLRRLEGEMASMELAEEDKKRYRARKSILDQERSKCTSLGDDLGWCVDAVQKFKVTCGASVA